MTDDYIPFGEPHPDLSPAWLCLPESKRVLSACLSHPDFDVVELRKLSLPNNKFGDVIVVDCTNDQVPTRNKYRIKVRERLALLFAHEVMPETRALRKDFPVPPEIMHQFHTADGEPASLCLYFESWNHVERSWTPQKHLRRILWWLAETAKGTLHRPDQPVEAVYFQSHYEIVLPSDFEKKINDSSLALSFASIQQSTGSYRIIRGFFVPKEQAKAHQLPQLELLMIHLPPIIHGPNERKPCTMGQLHDQLERRGAPILDAINAVIREKASPKGLKANTAGHCLFIFSIPMKLTAEADPERHDVTAFALSTDLASLGTSTGILTKSGDLYYAFEIVGGNMPISNDWRSLEVTPIEVSREADKKFFRKTSGINKNTADFKGVLAGVGALGSALAELWSKSAWGDWTLIDPDFIKGHNIVRHLARNPHIGLFKVDVVKEMIEANYHEGYYHCQAIPDSILNCKNERVKQLTVEADLVIDVTTTLETPRELAIRNEIPRCASIFLTPSAHSSVLLLESSDRTIRLDSLEIQYYRAIINESWGEAHLSGHKGALWVGAGCRDVSAIISLERIQLHAAIIAGQLRSLRDQNDAKIRIWSVKDDKGTLYADEIPIFPTFEITLDEWHVKWDSGLIDKLAAIRQSNLPSETGGVVVGFIDQKIKCIYIVDVLKAPPDSEADVAEFTRGVQGLKAQLDEVGRRTANIVQYIGEWHSHPAFSSAYPSTLDRELIDTLAKTLALEGQPAIMIIIGTAGELSISLKEG